MDSLQRPYLWLLVQQSARVILMAHKFEDAAKMATAMFAFGPSLEYYASTEVEYRALITRARSGPPVEFRGYVFETVSVEEGNGAVIIYLSIPKGFMRHYRRLDDF